MLTFSCLGCHRNGSVTRKEEGLNILRGIGIGE